MTHDEALELLELAAAEPDGFERLAAGDRPEAAALASHLAGCPTCRAEHDALRRLAGVLRTVLAELPADDLRDRTLTTVAELGRPRGAAAGATDPEPESEPGGSRPAPAARIARAPGPDRRRRLLGLAGLAAVLLVALGVGLVAGLQSRADELRRQDVLVGALERLAVSSLDIAAAPDATAVALAAPNGRAEGRVLFSAATRRLVVVASGLEPPPADREYRCWVEVNGERIAVGRMVFAADLAYWAGPAEALAAGSPTRFGISLVVADATEPGQPVLEGRP